MHIPRLQIAHDPLQCIVPVVSGYLFIHTLASQAETLARTLPFQHQLYGAWHVECTAAIRGSYQERQELGVWLSFALACNHFVASSDLTCIKLMYPFSFRQVVFLPIDKAETVVKAMSKGGRVSQYIA